MINKTVIYEDFDGNTQTETLWFNISKAEALELGVDKTFKKLMGSVPDNPEDADPETNGDVILKALKELIGFAYGTRDPNDARRFPKSPEVTADFLSSPAYDQLLIDLFSGDAAGMLPFMVGMFPKDMRGEIESNVKNGSSGGVKVTIPIVPTDAPTTLNLATALIPPAPSPVDDSVPEAFRPNPMAERNRRRQEAGLHKHGAPTAQGEVVSDDVLPAPKPLTEMNEEELRAELLKLRSS